MGLFLKQFLALSTGFPQFCQPITHEVGVKTAQFVPWDVQLVVPWFDPTKRAVANPGPLDMPWAATSKMFHNYPFDAFFKGWDELIGDNMVMEHVQAFQHQINLTSITNPLGIYLSSLFSPWELKSARIPEVWKLSNLVAC